MLDREPVGRLEQRAAAPVRRVALLSMHTCPLDQPGTGDSGGMNVYVLAVAKRLAAMGVEVDIFSRWSGISERVRLVAPGLRVIHLEAGPAEPVPKETLPDHVCEFLYSLLRFAGEQAERSGGAGSAYDVIHSHYWLSGWVGRLAAERLGIPLVQSFHTLGLVKNATAGADEPLEPPVRLTAEERIVAAADRILAPTPVEAAELVRLYGAHPDAVRVVTPGVDTEIFTPQGEAHLEGPRAGKRTVVFAGRLQPLKAPDLAVRALAAVHRHRPDLDAALVILGGPSGSAAMSPPRLSALAAELGIGDRVWIVGPEPHARLAATYRAADAVIVPSRTESFGLVALEASACGTPVVASDVGGLRTAVQDGLTGILVPERTPEAFAAALIDVLGDPARAASMGSEGARYARRFDWSRAASGLLEVYEEIARAAVSR